MDEEYSVKLEQRQIGSARISREGLYCHVVCTCEMREERVYILYAEGCGETLRLGILVPKNGKLCLDTKIPAKRFPQTLDEVYLLEKGKDKPKEDIFLKEGEPVCGLENIMHSKLQFTPDGALLIAEDISLRR